MQQNIIIGTGPMAVAYAEVFQAMGLPFRAIGRGEKSAKAFEEKTNSKAFVGGIDLYLENNIITPDTNIILATGTEALMPILLRLTKINFNKLLIEKPAAISIEELLANESALKQVSHKVFVAYNRRFYQSVIEAQKLIEEDGGLKTIHFEFTEWLHKIAPLEKAAGVKENWFFANSTHVIDLAFYLAGQPQKWGAYAQSGNTAWHKMTNFTGAGITKSGVLFSYMSNWESAGRWSIELLTNKRRIYLKPLEKISIQEKGALVINEHAFDDSLDIRFKPGIFKQTEAFLSDNTKKLLNLGEHIEISKNVYQPMLQPA